MIVSHKHKFIFVKTHKTSTQTFMKFVLPNLGADDVMAGDPEERDRETKKLINANTKLNVDQIFPDTGKCAEEYQDIYGNHLPWFMVKDIVGEETWGSYIKFTIERDPYDRFLSLFYFLNPLLVRNDILPSAEKKKKCAEQGGDAIEEMIAWSSGNTLFSLYPKSIRLYFEEWLLTQLEAETLSIDKPLAYGREGHEKEKQVYKTAANKFKFNKIAELSSMEASYTADNGLQYMYFPYINQKDALTRLGPYEKGYHMLGQCRFLNYGYYFDGKEVKVDHVINFKNVANDLGRMFNQCGINIKCNKKLYDQSTQNAQYRKNLRNKKPTNWWYSGPRGVHIKKVIQRRFFSKNPNKNQINLDQIYSKTGVL